MEHMHDVEAADALLDESTKAKIEAELKKLEGGFKGQLEGTAMDHSA